MTDYRVVMVYDEGCHLAVVGPPGRKWIKAVVYDCGNIHLTKFEKAAERGFEIPPGKEHKYRLGRVCRQLLENGRKFGITDGAKEFLKEAMKE